MTGPALLPSAGVAGAARRAKTWLLFVGLAAVMLAGNWYYREFVMTREVQALLFGDSMDATALEQRWQLYQRTALWSYAFTPVALWVQVAFVALTAQLGLLLWRIDVPFSRLFRATLVAQVVPVAQALAMVIRQARLTRSEISPATFYEEPGGVAGLLPPSWAGAAPVLEAITLFDLAWYTLLFLAFWRIAGVGRRAAGLVVLGLGVVFNFFEWAITAYVERLGA